MAPSINDFLKKEGYLPEETVLVVKPELSEKFGGDRYFQMEKSLEIDGVSEKGQSKASIEIFPFYPGVGTGRDRFCRVSKAEDCFEDYVIDKRNRS